LPLFILPLLNVPYLFIGTNENIFDAFARSIFVGIMEELIFRGCLFRGIEEKYNTQKAVVVTGIIFGLFHLSNLVSTPIYYVVLQVIYASAIGILFAVIFSMTDSLFLCIGIHFLVDMIAFIGGDNYNIIVESFFTIVCVVVTACYVVMWKKNEA
ncbi:MAG: CPBP family intramembrane metalloprotease, partial [Lachnospiraceae bacterium]|nr:CPBP family intramembrane metalloprotease [Lachnospiraceae bacterium]